MIFQLVPQAYAASITGANWDIKGCAVEGVATIKGIECLFQNILAPIPAIIALIAVGMIIFAGIRIITAGGDPKALAAAWSTFTWAVVGLVLLSVTWLVLILVKNFTGADVTNFGIPTL